MCIAEEGSRVGFSCIHLSEAPGVDGKARSLGVVERDRPTPGTERHLSR